MTAEAVAAAEVEVVSPRRAGRPSGLTPEARDRLIMLDGLGHGPTEIARALNDEGLPAPAGGQWGKSSVVEAAQRQSPPSMVRRAASLLEAATDTAGRLDAREAAEAARSVASVLRRTAERRAGDPGADEDGRRWARSLLDQARRAEVAASVIVHDAERAVAQANPTMTRAESSARAAEASAAARSGERPPGGADAQEPVEELPRQVQKARTVHERISDEDYEAARDRAVEDQEPLTRAQLRRISAPDGSDVTVSGPLADEIAEMIAGPAGDAPCPEAVAEADDDDYGPGGVIRGPDPGLARARRHDETAELMGSAILDLIESWPEDPAMAARLARIKPIDLRIVTREVCGHIASAIRLAHAAAVEAQETGAG